MSSMFPALFRASRHLLGISQEQVAQALGTSVSSIRRAENDGHPKPASDMLKRAYRAYLEKQGVTFIDQTKDHGPGVMLSRPERSFLSRPIE